MNTSYVSAGKPKVAGAIWRAPSGTTLPTTADEALDNDFVDLGYVSDDGVGNDQSFTADEVRAWGGDVVMTPESEQNDNFTMNLIESLNVNVLKTVYGDDNVTGTLSTGITVKKNAKDRTSACYVIDMILRDGAIKRIVLPDAKISALDTITYNDSDPIGYAITLTAMRDSAGQTHYEYIKGA